MWHLRCAILGSVWVGVVSHRAAFAVGDVQHCCGFGVGQCTCLHIHFWEPLSREHAIPRTF